jgi:hypothetical protein
MRVTVPVVLVIFIGIICAVSVPSGAATPDQFQQNAQRILDRVRGKDGWNASRCMIATNVAHDIVVTRTHDGVLRYGDRILEVSDQPLSSSVADPVIDALRRQPPSGSIRLKIVRDGRTLVVSAACSDSRPFQTLLTDALASVTAGNYGACAEKLSSAEALHELNWPSASIRFECRKRAGRLATSEAQALYEVDQQAIIESAPFSETLEKLRNPVLTDEGTLRRLGASDLAAQLNSAFEAAQNGSPSGPTNNDSAERKARSVAASAAGAGGWALSHQGDPISGEQSIDATLMLPGSPPTGVVIQCEPKHKHVFSTILFGTFLGDKLINVEFRVDQRTAVKASWLAMPKGTGVFEGGDEFAKGLAGGTTLYFRAYDYRGAGTLLTIPLGGSEAPLGEVLADCARPPALAGVDQSTIDEVDTWGPHVTVLNKTILARLGFFHDAIDATKPTSLTVAADQYHKKLREECTAKLKWNPLACTNYPIMYEISHAGTRAEQKEYGPLRISD